MHTYLAIWSQLANLMRIRCIVPRRPPFRPGFDRPPSVTPLSLQALTWSLVSQLLTLVANSIAFSRGRLHGAANQSGVLARYRHTGRLHPRPCQDPADGAGSPALAAARLVPLVVHRGGDLPEATACTRPFTPRNPRFVACPEMWHHYVFDRAINTTGLSPAGSQNWRLLHLGGTLMSLARSRARISGNEFGRLVVDLRSSRSRLRGSRRIRLLSRSRIVQVLTRTIDRCKGLPRISGITSCQGH